MFAIGNPAECRCVWV